MILLEPHGDDMAKVTITLGDQVMVFYGRTKIDISDFTANFKDGKIDWKELREMKRTLERIKELLR